MSFNLRKESSNFTLNVSLSKFSVWAARLSQRATSALIPTKTNFDVIIGMEAESCCSWTKPKEKSHILTLLSFTIGILVVLLGAVFLVF
jgi:hypothetical protein